MKFLKNFYLKTLQFDLINKHLLKNSKSVPKIKKIVLNFNFWGKPLNLKLFASSMFALELISCQEGVLTKTSSPNLSLKLRKGSPIGCKLTITKETQYRFLAKFTQEVSPSGKTFILFKTNKLKNSFSFDVSEPFSFSELEKHYNIFTELTTLNITLVTNSESNMELKFILKSLQLPLNL